MPSATPDKLSISPALKPVSFSSITGSNLETVRGLDAILFPAKFPDMFYEYIVKPEVKDFCKLVYIDNEPVGTFCCRFEEVSDETKLYLMTMGILEPYRSQKIGAKAVKHIVDAARAMTKPRIACVYLHVWTENGEAKRFYERHGFVEVGVAIDFYRKTGPRDAWILEYKLHPSETKGNGNAEM